MLVWKVASACAYEIAAGDFSGWRMPGTQKARRRGPLWKWDLQCEAAAAMVDSSWGGKERDVGVSDRNVVLTGIGGKGD